MQDGKLVKQALGPVFLDDANQRIADG